jgi:tetratricopeptide (TPR) repeat protein
MSDTSPETKALISYLGKYGDNPPAQSAADAPTDTQLKTLVPLIAEFLSRSSVGSIIDIGAGNGIILERIATLKLFMEQPGWQYCPVDFDDNLQKVLDRSTKLRLHRRVSEITLDAFHQQWPTSPPRPHLVVIRNVLHEIRLSDTARLFSLIASHLKVEDLLLIQDLEVFPQAERGNACWQPEFLQNVLKYCGFESFIIEEPTRSGNLWFTLRAQRTATGPLSMDKIRDVVIRERLHQYQSWRAKGALSEIDVEGRQLLAKIDFDLQSAALLQQLIDEGAGAQLRPLSLSESNLVVRETFVSHLMSFDVATIAVGATGIEAPPHFRDRAQDQDWLEDFLRSPESVIVVSGGAFIGKTYLTQEVIARRSHSRLGIILNVMATSSVWNILESLLAALGCRIGGELLAGIKGIRISAIENTLREFFLRVAPHIIVSIDHFERLLDPLGRLMDSEIGDLLKYFAMAPGSKIFVTTRRPADIAFLPTTSVFRSTHPPVGRFPRGRHVENILDDFVDRGQLGIKEYPQELLDAIDRHPFLTYLAGKIIQKGGINSISDPDFLNALREQLRIQLITRIVDAENRDAIVKASLVRIPIPREMLESLTSRKSVFAAEEAGLLYAVPERGRSDLLAVIGAFRLGSRDTNTGEPDETTQALASDHRETHRVIADWYSKLYRLDSDPRWLREQYYHTLLLAEPIGTARLGTSYKTEFYWAGNYWFDKQKNFLAALWAFNTAQSLGLENYQLDMRIAACQMRLGNRAEGEGKYAELMRQFPKHKGIVTSYIDTLLYLYDYSKALAVLFENFSVDDTDPWIAGQYGRAYLGLHKYKEAVTAFRVQLAKQKEPIVYDALARAYLRQGDHDSEARTLDDGLKRHPQNTRLLLAHAAHLVRTKDATDLTKAHSILAALIEQDPSNGWVLQQYVKVLCAEGDIKEAERVYSRAAGHVEPSFLDGRILSEIRKTEGRWEEALLVLGENAPSDEHLVGMKKEVYVAWADDESDEEQKIQIARAGLDVPMAEELQLNVPLIVISAKLAMLAQDKPLFRKLIKRAKDAYGKIREIERIRTQWPMNGT